MGKFQFARSVIRSSIERDICTNLGDESFSISHSSTILSNAVLISVILVSLVIFFGLLSLSDFNLSHKNLYVNRILQNFPKIVRHNMTMIFYLRQKNKEYESIPCFFHFYSPFFCSKIIPEIPIIIPKNATICEIPTTFSIA